MGFTLAVNVDEIGKNLDDIRPFLDKNHIVNIELRTIDAKNITHFTKQEIVRLKRTIDNYRLTVCAIASPLFKWYDIAMPPLQLYDSFGFPSILTDEEKLRAIHRIVEYSNILNVKKVRVFSGLHAGTPSIIAVYENTLLQYCVDYGARNRVQFLLENEPACNVAKLCDVMAILERFPNLHLWLDVANFYQLGEVLDDVALNIVIPRTRHIHLKDFVLEDGDIKYVPLGQGIVPWDRVLTYIFNYCECDISFSIETHVKEKKRRATQKGIEFFRYLHALSGQRCR